VFPEATRKWLGSATARYIFAGLSRERGRPLLQLLVYNREGALAEALTWVQARANRRLFPQRSKLSPSI
jgi:hypothetical protein